MQKRLIKLFCCVAVSVLTGLILIYPAISGSGTVKTPVAEGPVQQINQYFSTQIITYGDGTSLSRDIINGPSKPPAGFEPAAVALPAPNPAMGTSTLTVPTYNWVFGCSSVSGAMIAGYYDRNGYPNMYIGPANGGVAPLNNSTTYWPTWSDGFETYPNLPLAASHNGVDGRAIRGSIDDYWISYGSSASDPYITGSWTQHTWSDAIGDYMKTSQSAYGNTDGSTNFYNWTTSATQLTCSDMVTYSIDALDGTYGRKLFYEARGYTVITCYNQKTDNNGGGFTFDMYKAEIDAGRPVMLNLVGHTVVGVGYNDTGKTIYLHDTWHQNGSTQSMTWTGDELQTGMFLRSASIVNIAPVATDMAITMIDSPDPVTLGGNITYTITATNNGSAGTSTTTVTDVLPAGITYISASSSQGSCSGTSTVTCNLGAMSSGSHATISLIVTTTAANAALANTATVTSNLTDPTPANNTATATTVVNNPVPDLAGLSPSSASQGSVAFTLTVNGTKFIDGAIVRWNGANRATTFVSATQLTAAILAADVASATTANITVINPAPHDGDGASNVVTFAVEAPSAGGGGGGCFIATAAFGTPLEKHVQILRDFRDRFLLTSSAGQAFVKFYYEVSPPIAGRIAQSEGLRSITRGSLMPFVGMAYLMVTYGVTATLLLALSLMLMLGAVAWIIRRKMMMANS